jgi:RimJ/RimL family protein N-acetyltransferase
MQAPAAIVLAAPMDDLRSAYVRRTCRTVPAPCRPCISPMSSSRQCARPGSCCAMTDADVDDIHAYQSRPDVCRYLPFEPRTRDEVLEKVAKYSTALVLSGDGDFWQLAIERLGDPGRVIGDLYFTIKDAANATCEIGWTLHPDHTGSGYMTEAARAVLRIAFDDLGMHRASAVLDTRAMTRPPRSARAWACARRLISSRTCGSEAHGATPPSTRSSIENGQRSPPDGSRRTNHAATASDEGRQSRSEVPRVAIGRAQHPSTANARRRPPSS